MIGPVELVSISTTVTVMVLPVSSWESSVEPVAVQISLDTEPALAESAAAKVEPLKVTVEILALGLSSPVAELSQV